MAIFTTQFISTALIIMINFCLDSITVMQHDKNQGKGAALQTGFKNATGDLIAIQDADLEYNPNDILRVLEPLVSDEADVVFGSRFLPHGPHRVLFFALVGEWFPNFNLKYVYKFEFD